MDYKEIVKKLENNDKALQKEIINTINEEDYITIQELYFYLKNNTNKAIVNNYINIIIMNIKDIYDDEMNLNKNFTYLKEEQPLIIKYLLTNNYRFSDKQIKSMKNELLIQLPLELVIEEICDRLQKKHFSISLLILSKLKKVLNYACENSLNQVVEVMIDDYDFIIQYNNSNIDTTKILKLTSNISFREKIMTSNKFLQELKSNPSKLTPYLSQEEIIYLETDINIKNIFLSKGLRYDILDKSIIANLLDNINIFKTFPFTTINEFYLSIHNKEQLLEDEKFLNIYLEKIDDIYTNINLFKDLNKDDIETILNISPNELIYLNIFINTKEEYQSWLLEKEDIKKYLYNTKKYKIYNYLDHNLLLDILKNKDNIFNYYKYFDLLEETDLQELLNNQNTYNEFIRIIQENKFSISDINRILSLLDLSYQKKFVKQFLEFFPHNLYAEFFLSNIPLYLEVVKSNNINSIINNINSSNKEDLKKLIKTLSKDSLLKIKINEIEDSSLAKIINEFVTSKNSNITDIYLNTPIDELEKTLKEKNELVIDLIKSNIDNNLKLNIIFSSNTLLDIFLDNKNIKYYNRLLLISIIDKLNRKQKDEYLNNNLLQVFYSKEVLKVYNNLLEKNKDLIDTLNINFLNETTIKLKYNILEYLTKYKGLQNDIILLLDYISVKDITNLFLSLDGLDKEYLLPKISKIICESIKGKNRKKVGNFINFFKEIKNVTKEDWLNIISYLLYHLPLVPDAIKNNIVKVPSSYNDIKNYETDFYKSADDLLLKKYRLTREEIYYITNKYSKGYVFINDLNRLNLKTKAKDIKKSYKILDIYKELTKIKEDYNSKLFYELKKSTNNLAKNNNRIIKENYTLYTSKDKYTYLILDKSNMDYKKYKKYISSVTNSFRTTLLKDDNMSPENGLYFTYSNYNKNYLKDFDDNSFYLNKYSTSKNGNVLTLPDNLLVIEDNIEDLSLIAEAINIYKTFKPYKELKIILLNKEEIFSRLVENYKKNMTIPNLSRCIKMLSENNYIYSSTDLELIINKHLNSKDSKQVKRIIDEYNLKEYLNVI